MVARTVTTRTLRAPIPSGLSLLATGLLAMGLGLTACSGEEAPVSPASTPPAPDGGAKPAVDPLAGNEDGLVRVVYKPDGVTFQPVDAAWDACPASRIPLFAQQVTPPTGGGATTLVAVRAMHDGHWLSMRLQWRDDEPDRHVGTTTFRDSVAVGFPTRVGDAPPSPFMGDENGPVNIWQWTADFDANARGQGGFNEAYPHVEGVWYFPQDYSVTRQVRAWRGSEPAIEFEARGFGSLTRKVTQNVHGLGIHDKGIWSVVLRRRLSTGNPQDTLFRPGDSVAAIFAVWDGKAGEVNGVKSITLNWIPMSLDDTRGGVR